MKKLGITLLLGLGIFLLYWLISVVLFFPRWSHLSTHFGTPDFDTDSTIWYQWARIFTEQKGINFAYTNDLIAYPFGYDVSYIPYFSLIYEGNILLMKLLGGSWSAIITASNLSVLMSFPLGSFAAFLLTYYLTHKKYPSFISGLIFGFSFYHVMMMGGSLSLNRIEFIPIFYLSFLYFLDKTHWRSLLLSSIAFALLFMSNAYWAFFCMVFTPVFFVMYGKHSFKERVSLVMLYYPVVLFCTVIANLDYVWNQLYNLSPFYLQFVFPKTGSVKDQLLNTASFFSPSVNSVFRPWFYAQGEHFLGYAALGISFAAFFVRKKHRNYAIFLACVLLAILLASKVSPFLFINEIYFKFFRAFRAVSRLVIFASLFLGVLTAYSIDGLWPYIKKRFPVRLQSFAMVVLAILLPSVILLESFTLSALNRRITSFQRLAELYRPLRENNEIQRIMSYPLAIAGEGDGFPQNYELIGQVVHQKTLVGGISRFNPQARGFHEQITDLSDPRTIDVLNLHNIDTIVIYHNLYPDAVSDTEQLQKDSRVKYVGTFEQPKDENTYVSANDLSRKISIFQINDVVARNKLKPVSNHPEIDIITPTGAVEVIKKSAQEYHLKVSNVSEPFEIVFHEPYSAKWQILPGGQKLFGELSYYFSSPIFVSEHQIYQESENIWQINPQMGIKELPSQAYHVNTDSSVDLDLVLYFTPALLQYVSQGFRVGFFTIAFVLLIGHQGVVSWKRKQYEKKQQTIE
jgi:hypothetical protein